MFNAIEEAKTSELYRDTDEEEEMSVLSMSDEDEENAAILETAAEGEMWLLRNVLLEGSPRQDISSLARRSNLDFDWI